MKNARRLFALLIVLCLAFAVCPLQAFAEKESDIVKDDFSNGFSYVYNKYHAILILSGEGALPSFDDDNPAPWADYEGKIRRVVLGEGISEIPANAFSGCRNLASAVFPTSIETIGEGAFPRSLLFTTASTVGDTAALRRRLRDSGVFPNVTRVSQKSLDDEVETLSNPGFPVDYYYYVEDKRTLEQIREQQWRDAMDAAAGLK